VPAVALAGAGVPDVLTAARADLDLEEISSPAIASASTGSAAAASRSISKRGTSACVSGSIERELLSMPTVKSAEASKVSRAAARSITGPSG
jgi:hypothetical protein